MIRRLNAFGTMVIIIVAMGGGCDRAATPISPGPGLSAISPGSVGDYFIAAGETLTGTIWGSSTLSGEDWTGANCDMKACQMVHVVAKSPGTLSVRLNWSGPQNELGVFISTGHFGGAGAYGSSPLQASLDVRQGETLVVVSFEKSGRVLPEPQVSQAFELTTGFVARATSAAEGASQ